MDEEWPMSGCEGARVCCCCERGGASSLSLPKGRVGGGMRGD